MLKSAPRRRLEQKEKAFEKKAYSKAAEDEALSSNELLNREAEERKRIDAVDFTAKVSDHLYDCGREQVTPVCLHCRRETFFCKHREKPQRLGGYRQTSGDIGYKAEQVQRSVQGRVAVTKEFYDRGHLGIDMTIKIT